MNVSHNEPGKEANAAQVLFVQRGPILTISSEVLRTCDSLWVFFRFRNML